MALTGYFLRKWINLDSIQNKTIPDAQYIWDGFDGTVSFVEARI
jgi:hypothetical protein